jgi:hypothetical protein
MINNIKIFYRLSNLFYSEATAEILKTYQKLTPEKQPHLFNFSRSAKQSFFSNLIPSSKDHAELFELYLNFIKEKG